MDWLKDKLEKLNKEKESMSQTFIISSHHAEKAGHHMDLYLSTTEDCTDFLAFAIPKLMPTEKDVKHLAIKVANHSPEAAYFEGTVESDYGKGTKEIWDEGVYVPYQHIIAPKPLRIDFFGSKIVGTYYLKHWQGPRWLIWRS